MAIHARDSAMRVSVWARREDSRNACLQASWCHAASDNLEEALSESDLAVLERQRVVAEEAAAPAVHGRNVCRVVVGDAH